MAKEILTKREVKELKRGYTDDEIAVIEDIQQLYEKIKKLEKKEPFMTVNIHVIADHLVCVENAILGRCVAREFPAFFKGSQKTTKKGKKSK